MHSLKSLFPYLKSLCMVAAVVFIVVVSSHDSRIPDSLTPEQQEYVVFTFGQYLCQLEQVIGRIDEFTACPENEEACAEALIDAMNDYVELIDVINNDRLFFCRGLGALFPDSGRICADLDTAADKMTEEVLRRRDDPNFEVNQDRYDAIREALMETQLTASDEFCDPSECSWCKAQNVLNFYGD